MSITIAKRQAGDVTILEISGRITLGEGQAMLRDAIKQLVASGHTKILLDLGNTSYMDSAGLCELIDGFTTVANRGGQLKLARIPNKTWDLVLVTKLFSIFSIYADGAAALRAFGEQRDPAPQAYPNRWGGPGNQGY